MSPLLRAQQWYEHYVPNGNFGAELADFLVVNGNLLVVRPDIFLMAEQVRWNNEQRRIVAGEPNAYFVYLACRTDGAALLRGLLRLAPRPLPWALWSRNNNGVKAHQFQKLIRRI